MTTNSPQSPSDSGSEQHETDGDRQRLEAMEALNTCLTTIHRHQDPAPALDPQLFSKATALAAVAKTDPIDLEALFTAGWFYWHRYGALSVEADKNIALEVCVDALFLCFASGVEPLPEPLLPVLASEAAPVGVELLRTAQRTPGAELANAAVQMLRRIAAVLSVDVTSSVAPLATLAIALDLVYDRTGDLAALDEAIDIMRRICTVEPHRADLLSNLAAALHGRYQRLGRDTDLDEAIRSLRKSGELWNSDDPDSARYMTNLSTCLLSRHARHNVSGDLDEAVSVGRRAAELTDPASAERTRRLANLGLALVVRFERKGELLDLDEAIRTLTEAVESTPAGHADRAVHLSNLSNALRVLYRRTGRLADLDEAVATARESIEETPDDDPALYGHMSNLSLALSNRYVRVGSIEDLNEAIQVGYRGAEIIADDHPRRPLIISNLANALHDRYERLQEESDLDEAIGLKARAVELTPAKHSSRALRLMGMGGLLESRFRLTGDIADLEEAIAVKRQALAATPTDSPMRPMHLSNLGAALRTRSRVTGRRQDLDESITLTQRAHYDSPADSPDQGIFLENLASALMERYAHGGASRDQSDAVEFWKQAAALSTAPPLQRITAARYAARHLAPTDNAQAADLLETATRLVGEVVPQRLPPRDQQRLLAGLTGLASDAAALALAAGALSREAAVRALQLLELGRGVMLSQLLDVHGDLSELMESHPNLAARFKDLTALLNKSRSPDVELDGENNFEAFPTNYRARIATEFFELLDQIRNCPGFQDFLLPPSFADLQSHAESGPVVVLNSSAFGCNAIVITAGQVRAISLPDLTAASVADKVLVFEQNVEALNDPYLGLVAAREAEENLTQVLQWLWDTMASPVLDSLGHTAPPGPGQAWPRIWWMPTGAIARLPLHAAGYHLDAGQGHTVMDRVISSYTPTIRTLGHARQRQSVAHADQYLRSLIVGMPHTPAVDSPLPAVEEEVRALAARLPEPAVYMETSMPLLNHAGPPTLDAVLHELGIRSIAHFACHAYSDPIDPVSSILLLHDHQTQPLTLSRIISLELDHACLAFLSACQTSVMAQAKLIDESLHLTSAFQLAGYSHVIGTLWKVNDSHSSEIAIDFYTGIIGPGGIAVHAAAQVLHHVSRSRRDQRPDQPSLWAAHVHVGV